MLQHITASHASAQRGARVGHHTCFAFTLCTAPEQGAYPPVPLSMPGAGPSSNWGVCRLPKACAVVGGRSGVRGVGPSSKCASPVSPPAPFPGTIPVPPLPASPTYQLCPMDRHEQQAFAPSSPPHTRRRRPSTPHCATSGARASVWCDVRTAHVEERVDLVLIQGCARSHHLEVGACTPTGAFCEHMGANECDLRLQALHTFAAHSPQGRASHVTVSLSLLSQARAALQPPPSRRRCPRYAVPFCPRAQRGGLPAINTCAAGRR